VTTTVEWSRPTAPITSRIAYAAAHVVPRVESDTAPGAPADLDWDATLGIRRELWSWGLGVADAMDTAQRGMGLDWPATRELIRRSGEAAAAAGGRLVCGAGTDQLEPDLRHGLDAVIGAWREQVEVVRGAGAGVVLMASRALAAAATGPDDYLRAYDAVLSELDQPAILHWLGPKFDPALAGYWGSDDLTVATDLVVDLLTTHADRVDGIKVSLLDAAHEIELRCRLPAGVRLYTGDDFHYPELVVGDGDHHSDALLGIFAAIAPAASTALQALDAGDDERARRVLESTVDLARHVFASPTHYYKTGIAFLAWLNGQQVGFTMVGGLQSARSVPHLIRTHELAERAGLLLDPDLAAARMRVFRCVHGAKP